MYHFLINSVKQLTNVKSTIIHKRHKERSYIYPLISHIFLLYINSYLDRFNHSWVIKIHAYRETDKDFKIVELKSVSDKINIYHKNLKKNVHAELRKLYISID